MMTVEVLSRYSMMGRKGKKSKDLININKAINGKIKWLTSSNSNVRFVLHCQIFRQISKDFTTIRLFRLR